MPLIFDRLYGRLGASYLWLFVAFETASALTITLATCGLFALYQDMDAATFWRLVGVAEGFTVLSVIYVIGKTKMLARPVIRWIKDGKPAAHADAVWHKAIALPREMILENGWQPFALISIPVSVWFTLDLGLPWYSCGILLGATMVAIGYAAVLHFFASELFLRPIVEEASGMLDHAAHAASGVPLRWKLLGALPIINVITGVVVSGLSADATSSLRDLGVDVVVAVVVAFTISLELTLLVTRATLGPVDNLLAATTKVKAGDLTARVPVTSGDELGQLAGSFNEMLDGLAEREQLHSALGSYVDPVVADRVLAEGDVLAGDDAEVTVMFVDVRDFTPFAERSSARETVAFLSEFFDLVVPIVLEHGGHANKFIGDGMLAVFGAPESLSDHADRAVAAATAIDEAVAQRFGGSFEVGIGLNSGPVTVGTVGGGGRLEFAVIGDTVNVAARVEKLTRMTGDTTLITEATRCLLTRPDAVALDPRGETALKGKSDAVALHAAAPVAARTSRADDRLRAEA